MFLFYLILFSSSHLSFFFFNDTATTEIYTLSLHDALPISFFASVTTSASVFFVVPLMSWPSAFRAPIKDRSEEHTSELQSRSDLVCRLLLEKKKKIKNYLSRDIVQTKTVSVEEDTCSTI